MQTPKVGCVFHRGKLRVWPVFLCAVQPMSHTSVKWKLENKSWICVDIITRLMVCCSTLFQSSSVIFPTPCLPIQSTLCLSDSTWRWLYVLFSTRNNCTHLMCHPLKLSALGVMWSWVEGIGDMVWVPWQLSGKMFLVGLHYKSNIHSSRRLVIKIYKNEAYLITFTFLYNIWESFIETTWGIGTREPHFVTTTAPPA